MLCLLSYVRINTSTAVHNLIPGIMLRALSVVSIMYVVLNLRN